MKIYQVGGTVRDGLLGLAVQDRDWVVVGARAEDLLAQGYLPVGKDFPVFLHPQTREEYALARTERKTAPGYRGFAIDADPSVTLEEDLSRRDLSINAMALDDQGQLVDPYGGQADLRAQLLRHVSPAFSEDPVRILRVARFAARLPGFSVAAPTLALMREMVGSGEVDALVPERVWQELSRALMETRPSRFFEVLRQCGALARLMPEVDRLWGVPQSLEHHPEGDTGVHLMMVLDQAARMAAPLTVRFACLGHDLGKGLTPREQWPRHLAHEARSVRLIGQLSERLRVPTACRELAEVVAREHGHVHQSLGLGAAALVRLLERCDAFRKPQRFEEILLACWCDSRGRLGRQDEPYPQRDRLLHALALAQAVPSDQVALKAQAEGRSGPRIGQAVHQARAEALKVLEG
jgi:tRNA nucleotidyltransferase (CCA-adding enzyme)